MATKVTAFIAEVAILDDLTIRPKIIARATGYDQDFLITPEETPIAVGSSAAAINAAVLAHVRAYAVANWGITWHPVNDLLDGVWLVNPLVGL